MTGSGINRPGKGGNDDLLAQKSIARVAVELDNAAVAHPGETGSWHSTPEVVVGAYPADRPSPVAW